MCALVLLSGLMTVVFGLEMRLGVHMCTTEESGIIHNGQHLGSAVNSFINQGEFVTMKMLSDCKSSMQ